MKTTLALAMIVKNDKEEIKKSLNAINSVKDYVDEICITLTDDKEKLETNKIPKEYKNYKVSHFKWIKDFSKARMFNYSQVTSDWILWLDADDILTNARNLSNIIEKAEQNNIKGFVIIYWYLLDKYGKPIETHPKIQIIKNDGSFLWSSKRIHENLSFSREVKLADEESIIRIHKFGNVNQYEKSKRNLELLLLDRKDEGDNPDPRTLFYLGRTYLMLNELDLAIENLLDYVKLSGWQEEIYEAYLLMGDILKRKDMPKDAILSYELAIKLIPDFPEAYYGMGYCYFHQEDWKRAISWFETGLTKKSDMKRVITTFIADITWKPLGAYAYCLLQIGKFDEAKNVITTALRFHSQDDTLWITKQLIDEIINKRNVAKSYVKISKFLEDEKKTELIEPLLNSVPNILQDDPLVLSIKNEHLKPKQWDNNEIVFYCYRTVEPWSFQSIKKGGIGGSETAIIELSKRLQKLGWKVTIYNWCSDKAGIYDGVIYKNFWEFNWKDEFNILILWRKAEYLDFDIKAKFIGIDMHDVGNVQEFTKKRLEKINKIFVKTKAHRELYPEIPNEKFCIINNGIDPERFNQKVERDNYKIIYSSTPDRGLDTLLRLFPKIKEQVPQTTLNLYYGKVTFEKFEKDNPSRMRWLKNVENMLNQKGVINHERINQWDLAKEFLSGGLWTYPTDFYEISCITGMEAQASGLIPITINYAALKETVQFGVKVDGEMYKKETQDKWISETIRLLKDHKKQEFIRKKMMPWARDYFNWDKVAQKWDKVFNAKNE